MKRIGNIVAIAAVLVLVLIIAPGIIRRPNCGQNVVQLQLDSVVTACSQYLAEFGEPPASLADLDHNRKNIVFIEWGKSGTNDGWGNPIRFKPYDPSRGYGSVTAY